MKRIESAQNQQFKKWKKLHMTKWREKTSEYLIEGPHLLLEALKTKGQLTAIIYDEGFVKPESWDIGEGDEYVVDPNLFNELSQTETSQGVLAVCRSFATELPVNKGRYLLVDSVQDPGNLGTIIRTADACGMDGVFLGTGCVDLYNNKVLRSAQGSHFHLPIVHGDLIQAIHELRASGVPVFGTSLQGEPLENSHRSPSNFALLIGNEGNGVHSNLLALSDINVKIPIYGEAESINVAVAAGILMYQLRAETLA